MVVVLLMVMVVDGSNAIVFLVELVKVMMTVWL